MISSRIQEFKYQHKTIALANCRFQWVERHTLILFLPKDLIEVKNLYVHLAINFPDIQDYLGIPPSQIPPPRPNYTPQEYRKIAWFGGDGGAKNLNIGLGSNGIAELKHDFSRELSLFDIADGKPPTVNNAKTLKLQFGCGPIGSDQNNTIGEIILWKVDIVYTTAGIR